MEIADGDVRVYDGRHHPGERAAEPELEIKDVVHVLAELTDLAEALGSRTTRPAARTTIFSDHRTAQASAAFAGTTTTQEGAVGVPRWTGSDQRPNGRSGPGTPSRPRPKRPGDVVVVAVDVGDDVAGRPRQALVDRVGLSAVRLANPAGEAVEERSRISTDPSPRAAVDDDVLDVWVVLVRNRLQGAFKVFGLVQGRSHDADERRLHAAHSSHDGCRRWRNNGRVPGARLRRALRGLLRPALRRFGYDFVRFDSRSDPASRRAELIRERGVDLVLDVGANDGPFAKQLRGAGYCGRIVSFEPQATAFAALRSAAAADPRWECRNVAVGVDEGEVGLNIAANSSSSSLFQMSPLHVASAPESAYVGRELVNVQRLDSLAGELGLAEATVYLKVDVQGGEFGRAPRRRSRS